MKATWKNRAALFSLSIVLTATLLAGCDTPIDAESAAADLVLTHGKIVTVDPTLPEAEALAVVGDTTVAIGSSDELAQYIGPTTPEIDPPGKLAIRATKPLANQHDLAMAYSPGVAAACEEIVSDPAQAALLTARGNLVAVISNGTAVLQIGRAV